MNKKPTHGLSLKFFDYRKVDGHVKYLIKVEHSPTQGFWEIRHRFSTLLQIHKELIELNGDKALPRFPKKVYWGNLEYSFIQRRKEELETYFNLVLQNGALKDIKPLLDFFLTSEIGLKCSKYFCNYLTKKPFMTIRDCGPNQFCTFCWSSNNESCLHHNICDDYICLVCQKHYVRTALKSHSWENFLRPQKDENMEFSSSTLPKPQNDPNQLNFVLLGPSGAGKSSLINLFFLWANEFQAENLKTLDRIPIKTTFFDGDDSFEKNIFNQKESCTQSSSIYSFSKKNSNHKLRFLDTPGIGDTRGIAQDDSNIIDICDKIQNFGNVTAVFLVFNGSEARFSSRLQYVLKKIEGFLKDDLLSNVILLFTNVNSKPNVSYDLFQSLGVKSNRIFTLNNQLFLLSKEELSSEKIVKQFSNSFNNCLDVLSEIFDCVAQCEPKLTALFKEVKENRSELNKYCQKFYQRMLEGEKTKNDLAENLLRSGHGKPTPKMGAIQDQLSREKKRQDELILKIQKSAAKIKKVCSKFELVGEIEKTVPLLEEEMVVLTALQSEKGTKFEEKTLSDLKGKKNNLQLLSTALLALLAETEKIKERNMNLLDQKASKIDQTKPKNPQAKNTEERKFEVQQDIGAQESTIISFDQIKSAQLLKYLQDPNPSKLVSIYLAWDHIEIEVAKFLSKNTSWINLQKLNLNGNSIGDEGAKHLSQNISWINLQVLKMTYNSIGEEGAQYLRQNIYWVNLQELDLCKNSIGAEGAKYLSKNASWKNLKELNLTSNSIGAKGAKYLSRNISWKNLKTLELKNNSIGAEGAKYLRARWPKADIST